MGLMKKLTSAIVASSLVFGMVGSAMAAYTPAAGETAGTRMMGLQILKGKSVEDPLALKDEITRAELVTIIVRAFGKEADAALLNGAAAFPDTASHWASGNIAMAKALVEKAGGDAIGMPDGSFSPDAKLTPAQAVAFLMKFIGVKADATKAWPANYLDVAVEKGLITAEDSALISPMLNDNATRGLVFYMFDRAFYNYDLGAGKTFYTKYVDPTKPVVTLNKVEPTTLDSKVTITGKVEGATELYVGTKAITADANGNFSFDYDLPEVKEYNIAVTARDLAGNVDEESVTVARATGTAATIEASAVTVAAGATADVAATVKDAKGNALTGVTVTGESAIGTYADGKFTAGTTAGTGKLTLKAGDLSTTVDVTVTAGALAKVEAAAASVAPGAWTTVVAKDAYGNTVTGATFSESEEKATVDATTGAFIASEAGDYTVKATKDGVTVEGKVGVFGDIAKFVVSAPATAIGNGETYVTATATAVDGKGNVISNFDKKVTFSSTDGITFGDAGFVIKAVNGVATVELKADAALTDSTIELKASYTNADNDTFTGKASLDVVGQIATSIKVSAPDYLPTNDADAPVAVTVEVLDQVGEVMTDGAWDFSVALTGPATLEAGKDTKTGTKALSTLSKTFNVYPVESGEAGNVGVSVSFVGLTAGQDTMKAAYAQNAKTLVLTSNKTTQTVGTDDNGNYIEYTVKSVDKNGVPSAPESAVTVNVKFDGVADADKDNVYVGQLVNNAWVYTEITDTQSVELSSTSVKFRVASEKAKTFKVSVADKDANLTASSAIETAYTADVPAQVGFSYTEANVLRGNDGTTANLTAQLYDQFGNKAAKAGVELTLIDATGNYDGITINGKDEDVTLTTDANGAATATVKFLSYALSGSFELTGSYNETALLDYNRAAGNTTDEVANADLTIVDVLPTSLAIEVRDAASATKLSSYVAGFDGTDVDTDEDGITVRVTVKDNYGRPVTGLDNVGAAYSFNVEASEDDAIANISDWSETATAGVYEANAITPHKAGTFTLTVSLTNLANDLEASKSIAVKPGTPSEIRLTAATYDADNTKYTMTVKADEVKEYTVNLVDAFGNQVTSSQNTTTKFVKLEATAASGKYASFRNSSGAEITSVKMLPGYNSVKFFFVSNDTAPVITLTLIQDSATAGTQGTLDQNDTTVDTLVINPAAPAAQQ